MRLRVVRDGRTEEVEVASDLSSVTLSGRTYPVVVVRTEALRVELEIGGERVLVENWPDHFPAPPSPVDVNGERAPVKIEVVSAGTVTTSSPVATARTDPAPPPSSSSPTPSEGTPVMPPMPGRVIELRVSEGQRVDAGSILLVVEAMKMRNEVASPVAGVVRGLRVAAGSNVRSHEPMLYVAPL